MGAALDFGYALKRSVNRKRFHYRVGCSPTSFDLGNQQISLFGYRLPMFKQTPKSHDRVKSLYKSPVY